MMGRLESDQDKFFYEFCLEDHVPWDHVLRLIDAHLDLDEVRLELRPFYSHIGRPSVDPELMIRMLIIGYCFGIRSERRLCQEVDLNLAYRWFCRLGLEDPVPDHSTFSLNRHGRFHEAQVFRLVFEHVVATCMKAGLVGGEGFAVDASVIEANASRFQRVEGSEIDWTDKQRASRPVAAYLAALETEASPLNPSHKPKALSPTDPSAAWTTRGRHKVQFGYSANYLLDLQDDVVVDVEATPTRISKEREAADVMVERTDDCFGLKPDRLAADVAYGTGEFLGRLIDDHGIDPHIPVWERSKKAPQDKFTRSDFTYDQDKDVYLCPNGKLLTTSGNVNQDGKTIKYIARRSDCASCPLRPKCTTGLERRLHRDVNEEARNHVRALMETEGYRQSARERKKIETRFGDLKRNLGFTRLKLRGLAGANEEFLLAATVQNLRRLAKLVPRPPPQPIPA